MVWKAGEICFRSFVFNLVFVAPDLSYKYVDFYKFEFLWFAIRKLFVKMDIVQYLKAFILQPSTAVCYFDNSLKYHTISYSYSNSISLRGTFWKTVKWFIFSVRNFERRQITDFYVIRAYTSKVWINSAYSHRLTTFTDDIYAQNHSTIS